MNKIGIIIAREFNERVRKKSFIITTILMPLLMLGLMAAPTLMMVFAKGDQKTLLVIDESGVVAGVIDLLGESFRNAGGVTRGGTVNDEDFHRFLSKERRGRKY